MHFPEDWKEQDTDQLHPTEVELEAGSWHETESHPFGQVHNNSQSPGQQPDFLKNENQDWELY